MTTSRSESAKFSAFKYFIRLNCGVKVECRFGHFFGRECSKTKTLPEICENWDLRTAGRRKLDLTGRRALRGSYGRRGT